MPKPKRPPAPPLAEVIREACELARREPGGLERFLLELRQALHATPPAIAARPREPEPPSRA